MSKFIYSLLAVSIIVCFTSLGQSQKEDKPVQSTMEIFTLKDKSRKVLYRVNHHFEAPNWSRDGKFLIYNSKGKLYKMAVTGGDPELINTGLADRCNNDHGISPDNKEIVVSHHEKISGKSMIYILPFNGGIPRLVTQNAPSYWHGWSPAGDTLVYCAERNGEFDIYKISVKGGEEKRLTSAVGLDDGPDYTADGKYIYFNSVRTGKMKIWRMLADGSTQEQITFDEYNDWFAHPSPDGKWLVFVSYEPDVDGHPANKNVTLRIMPLAGGKPQVIAKLFGGQGTINVPSWSPDSKRFAFVSYTLLK